MKPEETAWRCVYALRAMTGQPHGKFWLAADALESGDLRIVSGHSALLCHEDNCGHNTVVSCSLLKAQIARLAALEEVARHADVAKSDTHDTCDDYIYTGDNRLACPFCQAVAELDALDKVTP